MLWRGAASLSQQDRDSNARLTNMLRNDKHYVCVCVCVWVDRIIMHCDRLVGKSVGGRVGEG